MYPLKLHSSTLRGREALAERQRGRGGGRHGPPAASPRRMAPDGAAGRPPGPLLHDGGGGSEAGGGRGREEERLTGNRPSVRRAQHAGTAPAAQGLTGGEREGSAAPPRPEGQRVDGGPRGSAHADRASHCPVKIPPDGPVRGTFPSTKSKPHDFPAGPSVARRRRQAGRMAATAVAARTEAASPAGGGKKSAGGSELTEGRAAGLQVWGAGGGFVWVSVVCGGARSPPWEL